MKRQITYNLDLVISITKEILLFFFLSFALCKHQPTNFNIKLFLNFNSFLVFDFEFIFLLFKSRYTILGGSNLFKLVLDDLPTNPNIHGFIVIHK